MMKKFYNTPEIDFIVMESEKDILFNSKDTSYGAEPDEYADHYGNIRIRY